jgi:hypothetical protein
VKEEEGGMDLREDEGDDVSVLTREDEDGGVMENDPSLQRVRVPCYVCMRMYAYSLILRLSFLFLLQPNTHFPELLRATFAHSTLQTMAGDHKCPVCQATFTRPQHVARHMRSRKHFLPRGST